MLEVQGTCSLTATLLTLWRLSSETMKTTIPNETDLQFASRTKQKTTHDHAYRTLSFGSEMNIRKTLYSLRPRPHASG